MAYYEELNPILMDVIGARFLRNQNLCKLLYYYDTDENGICDPLSMPDIKNPKDSIYMKHIYPMPKIPQTVDEKEAYISISFSGGYEPEKNKGYRSVFMLIDIIVHLDAWEVKNGFRLYSIQHEIAKLLDDKITDLPIFKNVYDVGFQARDYSNYFYGLQMKYNLVINNNIVFDKGTLSKRIQNELLIPN